MLAMASNRGENVRNASISRIIVLSSDPPKKPEITLTGVPIPAAMTTTPKPTSSETRAPYKTRDKLAVLPCL